MINYRMVVEMSSGTILDLTLRDQVKSYYLKFGSLYIRRGHYGKLGEQRKVTLGWKLLSVLPMKHNKNHVTEKGTAEEDCIPLLHKIER